MTKSLPSEYKGKGALKYYPHRRKRPLRPRTWRASLIYAFIRSRWTRQSPRRRKRHTPVFVRRQYRENQYSEIEIRPFRPFQLFLLRTFDACTLFPGTTCWNLQALPNQFGAYFSPWKYRYIEFLIYRYNGFYELSGTHCAVFAKYIPTKVAQIARDRVLFARFQIDFWFDWILISILFFFRFIIAIHPPPSAGCVVYFSRKIPRDKLQYMTSLRRRYRDRVAFSLSLFHPQSWVDFRVLCQDVISYVLFRWARILFSAWMWYARATPGWK